jgi:hypothetical protein
MGLGPEEYLDAFLAPSLLFDPVLLLPMVNVLFCLFNVFEGKFGRKRTVRSTEKMIAIANGSCLWSLIT